MKLPLSIIHCSLFIAMALPACTQTNAPSSLPAAQNPSLDRGRWMREARWGVFTHYLADWKAQDLNIRPMTIDKWNNLVDHVDADALADQLQKLGVKYYFLTIGQNSGYFAAPN